MLYPLLVVVSVLSVYYFFLLLSFRNTWIQMPEHSLQTIDDPFVSIIVIARDEEQNIKSCLKSIVDNDYPSDRYEIILVDDHSRDRTTEYSLSLGIENLKMLSLADYLTSDNPINAYKKHAQKIAVDHAQGEILLFTDADVIVPKGWIKYILSGLTENARLMITGPIVYKSDGSILQNFQSLDIAGTMLMTATGISTKTTYLANGANMVISKGAYLKHASRIENAQASGDDVFLIQSIARTDKEKIAFLKSKHATTITYPEQTWQKLLTQRLRWASKTTSYRNSRLTFQIAMIYLFNLSILVNMVMGLMLDFTYLSVVIAQLLVKFIADSIMLREGIDYFQLKISKSTIPFYSILNCIYILVVGTLGLLPNRYVWKGRRVL